MSGFFTESEFENLVTINEQNKDLKDVARVVVSSIQKDGKYSIDKKSTDDAIALIADFIKINPQIFKRTLFAEKDIHHSVEL